MFYPMNKLQKINSKTNMYNSVFYCAFCGDETSGKTQLLNRLFNITFSEYYEPTTIGEYKFKMNDKLKTDVRLCDTSGQIKNDALRYITIQMAKCAFICISLDDKEQLKTAKKRFVNQLRKYKKSIPIVVVGTKSDMREDKDEIIQLKQMGRKMIETEDGIKFAQSFGAVGYFECSAKTKFNIHLVLQYTRILIKIIRGY
ncbi:GTP-binding protein RHO1 precursor, putative [Entamoeba invadens IP1]|uniref:small monomeric GTPase n=1 Tax=Entamoeba invadens IP1 TaxID=370355 RepID=L7FPJ0_ENTIV|nr:GTP-binding protein RHO1 precursor, putative [Entamoeba invadens IP1]ELP95348.1 GTP-binding protein RHO1 precursor, putative [Entamoeba invadens IP1]|eukprot:XP_004262119.1 GTP-binding protein RHO1 precursor, putative [Entamoeba invadens IP1]